MINLDNPKWEYIGQGSYGEVYRLAGTNLALKLILDGHEKAMQELFQGLAVRKSKYAPRFYGIINARWSTGHKPAILMEYVGTKTMALKYSRFKRMLSKANDSFNKYGYEIFDPNIANFRVIRNKKGGIKKFWYVDMGGIRKHEQQRS